jgi:hypothetical protein
VRDTPAGACHDASVTRQESETELAGKLAASLTPRIQQMQLQQRGEQSSGLFDIGAMYAASVEQVMRRAQAARQPLVGVGVAEANPFPGSRPVRAPFLPPDESTYGSPAEVYEEIDLASEYALIPGLRPRGQIGRFAVGVAWLAIATLAAGVATMVPAHGLRREVAPVVPVAAVGPAPESAHAPEPALESAPASAPALESAPTPAPLAAQSPKARPAVPTHAHPVSHVVLIESPVSSPPPVAKAPVASDAPVALSGPKPAAPTPKVAAAAPAAPAGGGSLEDLIRQAVAADAKKH